MSKKHVGIVGVRGMVGSVLMQRMREEGDFQLFHPHFFSTSQVGMEAPTESEDGILLDGNNLEALAKMEMIITSQGSDYTRRIFSDLRKSGWKGFWIDAASLLRMESGTQLLLDPVNLNHIRDYLHRGGRDLIGANCTVSLLLMAVGELIKQDLVEWISSMTYQAASGAGAQAMAELIGQMSHLIEKSGVVENGVVTKKGVELDQAISKVLGSGDIPTEQFGVPLALSLIPWIDSAMESGQTREEWKGEVEANKILALDENSQVAIDGHCVRVGAMRSHSQGLVIKLKQEVPLDEVKDILQRAHSWLRLIDNNRDETIRSLSPAAVSGGLDIAVGRVRTMSMGRDYLSLFTVGDQLLWGAAEPLRRGLRIILEEF